MRLRAIIVALLAVMLAACASPVPGVKAADPVVGYAAILDWLYRCDDGLNAHTMAIDASGTDLAEPSRLIEAIKADPRYAKHEIIAATRAELQTSGRIPSTVLEFPDGFLIEFSHSSITDGKVTVDASKWASGDGAVYATLTARWAAGTWVVDEPESVAIA